MDALSWLRDQAALRIPAGSFSCLEGCGFCCTYPPQLQPETLDALRDRGKATEIGVDPQGTTRLPLQGGCGGCVLLEDRACTAYDLRPMHCRLFPFHVYFGRTVEIYANRVCPGLDHDVGGQDAVAGGTTTEASWADDGMRDAIARAASTVDIAELERNRDDATDVHGRFERIARAHDAWADVEQAREHQLSGTATTQDAWDVALGPLRSEADELLPTMVLPPPSFEWRAWRAHDGTVTRLRFSEAGEMDPVGTFELPDEPPQPSPAGRRVVERLSGYECFVGATFDLVDFAEYERTVTEAAGLLLDEMAASIALRELLVEEEGLEAHEGWLAAAYEPEFFDLPTIGAWL